MSGHEENQQDHDTLSGQTENISPPMIRRQRGDETTYPDIVYQTQGLEIPRALLREGEGWAHGGTAYQPRQTAFWILIALICFSLLCLMGAFAASLYQAYRPFREKVSFVTNSTFAQGILVDGISIGGMTWEEAKSTLESRGNGSQILHLTVRAGDKGWIISEKELPLTRNLPEVMETGYAVGRQGSRDTIAASVTPFEYRYEHLIHTAANPVNLFTTVTYDPLLLHNLIRFLESEINRDAVNAQVASFDFNSRSFSFTQEQEGARLDADSLFRDLSDALNQKHYTAVVQAQVETIAPQVSRVELMNSFSLISSYSTTTTSDTNRNQNIRLACDAVMGTVIMPGETFSFNGTTGQRTADKGYLPASAISGGTTVEEVGGGVCQVSSTLFNAAAMAGMTILSRSPHAWPSNYVEKGRDATVNWPDLDFTFRNDRSAPVFLVAYYQQRQCTVEIYGPTLGAGASIRLETELISTAPPPAEPLYEFNPLLPSGTVQEKIKARTGYDVNTYRVYLMNGKEVRRELLCSSSYPMMQQVLEYNY